MNRSQVFERVAAFISEQFELDRDSIKLETRFFEDLGLDSIDAVELVLELGELTGETVKEDDLRSIVTISDIVDLALRLRGTAADAEVSPSDET